MMSANRILPDDPRLTAYALGELDPTERDLLERLLTECPAAQDSVREIQELAGLLAGELRQEAVPALTPAQRAAILAAPAPAPVVCRPMHLRAANPRILRFASLATLSALVVVVALILPPAKPPADRYLSARYWNDDLQELPRAEPARRRNGPADAFELLADGDHDGNGVLLGDGAVRSSSRMFRQARGLVAHSESESIAEESLASQLDSTDEFRRKAGGFGGLGGGSGLVREKDAKIRNAPDAGQQLARSTKGAVASAPQSGSGVVPTVQTAPLFTTLDAAPAAGEPAAAAKPLGKPLATSVSRPDGRFGSMSGLSKQRTEDLAQRAARPNQAILAGGGEAGSVVRQRFDVGDSRDQAEGLKPVREQDARLDGRRHFFFETGVSSRYYVGVQSPEADNLGELTEGRTGTGGRADRQSGAEVYDMIVENPFLSAYADPLSTFGVDVDTASYANVRRFLTQGQLPPPNAVRIEELVNYFAYDYPPPAGDQPFSVNVETGRCPWSPGHGLVRIALKGKEIAPGARPAGNLVFLVDVSGSMQSANKLPLVKSGLSLLARQMTETDRVAIVTYSDAAELRLESTNGTNQPALQQAIESLQAGGSTNGAAGIQLAYRSALEHFIPGGTNRVILCTDGDFNVGVTGDDELVQLIEERARTKVFFSVFGFGMGNLKDGKLEKLADKGNGHYGYIDNQREVQKVFVDELAGTLVTIAKDVKLQVEFNPRQVGTYRLIGYENRRMPSQDFHDDARDAGDIGAGHTVTALYEITPPVEAPRPELGNALRYRKAVVAEDDGLAGELLTLKLRFKRPEADASVLMEFPTANPAARAADRGPKSGAGSPGAASADFNWAAAVAAFGMILRDSPFRGQANFDLVLELAQGSKGEDKTGRRQEFIELVRRAQALDGASAASVESARTSPPEPGTPAAAPTPPLSREQAEEKAGVNGKYRNLLRMIEAASDRSRYGDFHDFGRWQGTSYLGQDNLPQGFWVYVYPRWYIWGDAAK